MIAKPFFAVEADGKMGRETRHKLKKLSWTGSYDSDVACDADCFDKFLHFSNDTDASNFSEENKAKSN